MASRSQDDLQDPNQDPYQQLRNRVLAQQQSSEPTTDTGAAGDSGSAQTQQNPIQSADFQSQIQPTQTVADNSSYPVTTISQNPNTGYQTNTQGTASSSVSASNPYGWNGSTYTAPPAGMQWDASLGNFVPTTNSPSTQAQIPSTGRTNDPNAIAAQVAQWASMPGADPSLRNDPNYWVQRIIQTGGLGSDNLTYWQNAGVGPTAFFNNPGRESGGGSAQTGTTQNFTPSPAPSLASYGLTIPQGLWSPDFMNQLRQIIMSQLSSASQPVSGTDPNIMTAVNAARDQAQRQSDQQRTDTAERLYAQGGLNTNALNQAIQQSNERTATSLGSLRANLIMNEVQQRRSQLQSLLQMALSAGDADMARQIQAQIAALNAQLNEEAQANGLAMFGAQLNQNAALAGLNG